ncbi:lachesin-like [Oratosquilla oratoria]|uniref:lachesin-like n=1 Tax=Oratosquilla oratoria TaxID=337810 RepID=UPI003F762B1B
MAFLHIARQVHPLFFLPFLLHLALGNIRETPKFLEAIPNMNVTKGRDVSIPCMVDNIGEYKVAWMHIDRKMLLAIDETVITLIPRFYVTRDDPRTWTLHISDVQPDDSGYYVCQVNMVPMINQVGYLQVVVPPRFLDEESSQSHVAVPESSRVRLVCRAEGKPAPTISWKREDGKALLTARGKNAQYVESEELVLESVQREDMGAYICIASNKVPPSISKRVVLDVNFQPVITVPNQLVGAPLGTSVTLECKVDAFPKAVHYWRFNSQLLINSTKQETQESRKGYTTTMKLIIHDLKTADFGTYVCGAKNSLGETEGTVRLYEIVVPKNNEEKTNKYKDPNTIVVRTDSKMDSKDSGPWKKADPNETPHFTYDDTPPYRSDFTPRNPYSRDTINLGSSSGSHGTMAGMGPSSSSSSGGPHRGSGNSSANSSMLRARTCHRACVVLLLQVLIFVTSQLSVTSGSPVGRRWRERGVVCGDKNCNQKTLRYDGLLT